MIVLAFLAVSFGPSWSGWVSWVYITHTQAYRHVLDWHGPPGSPETRHRHYQADTRLVLKYATRGAAGITYIVPVPALPLVPAPKAPPQ